MKIFLGLLIIIFLVFSGYHLTFRGFRLPLFARQFYLTGTEFLFLGILLGPRFLNLLDEKVLTGLEPLIALILGWIGMLFGFQFELTRLRRFPSEFLGAALLEGFITFVWVFAGVCLTLAFLPDIGISGFMKTMTGIALGAAAACTAQTGLAMTRESVEKHRNLLTFLSYVSTIDGLIPLLIFGLGFSFSPWVAGHYVYGISSGIIASLSLALLYALFLTRPLKEGELILVVVGMAVLTSGTASAINFSPLLSSFLVGSCLVNISEQRNRIFSILAGIEKPVYLLVLIFLGVMWQFDSGWILLLAVGYALCRMTGKILGGGAITRSGPEPVHPGFGLLEMGGLSLAILLDFRQAFPLDTVCDAVSVALVAVIYNNFISSYFLERMLKRVKRIG